MRCRLTDRAFRSYFSRHHSDTVVRNFERVGWLDPPWALGSLEPWNAKRVKIIAGLQSRKAIFFRLIASVVSRHQHIVVVVVVGSRFLGSRVINRSSDNNDLNDKSEIQHNLKQDASAFFKSLGHSSASFQSTNLYRESRISINIDNHRFIDQRRSRKERRRTKEQLNQRSGSKRGSTGPRTGLDWIGSDWTETDLSLLSRLVSAQQQR